MVVVVWFISSGCGPAESLESFSASMSSGKPRFRYRLLAEAVLPDICGEVIPPPRTHNSSMSACYLFWRHTTQVHVEPGLELVPIPAISNLVLMHDHEQSGLRKALIIFACAMNHAIA